MQKNNQNTFTWFDLSTFDVEQCKKFYHQLFDWDYFFEQNAAGEEYFVAYQDLTAVAGIYEMPAFFKKINMPSFWMSYIRVENITAAVEKARVIEGVRVEVEPTVFSHGDQIALVRDPSGAGFTFYEGKDLLGRFESGHGRPVWTVHHVSDIHLIEPFYKSVLDWSFREMEDSVYEVVHVSGDVVAHVEVLPEFIKGDKQYWMPIFGVDDVIASVQIVKKLGGKVLMELSNGRVMCADDQGGSFLLTDSN